MRPSGHVLFRVVDDTLSPMYGPPRTYGGAHWPLPPKAPHPDWLLLDHWQDDGTRRAGRVIHALRGFDIVRVAGLENVGEGFLGVTVVDREPSALHLHHDAVALQESMRV